MGSRDDRFVQTMGQAVPAWEVVVGSSDESVPCSDIRGVALHPTGQPEIPDEPVIARFIASVFGAIAIGEDGTAGAPDAPTLAKTGECGGVFCFTDRRVVGTLTLGEFVGMRLNHQRDQRAVLMSLDYSHVESMEMMSRKKMFGGRTPVSLQLSVFRPAIAAVRLEVVGETTLELKSSRAVDLPARFEQLVQTVCQRLLPDASGAAREQLSATSAGRYETSENGDPVAVFQPEEGR